MTLFRRSYWALTVVLMLLFFLAGLKAVDMVLVRRGTPLGSAGDPAMSQPTDPARPDISVNTLDLYPWTGGHTQAHARLNGGRFRTGPHGFFVDFDLDRPPPKKPGEFRVVLIGGSAAAGWGASGNEAMLYRVLEKEFATLKSCGPARTLSVVNLAMGGAIAQQNFAALNRWGHALQPDLLLSFSGINDLAYMWGGVDGWFGLSSIQAYVLMSRYEASPRWLKALAKVYPGLVKNTAIGMAVRSFYLGDYEKATWTDYISRYPPEPKLPAEGVRQIAIPRYVHSLQSIKRDFLGIPMLVVYQPFMATSANPGSIQLPMPHDQYRELYAQFIAGSRKLLDGYMNEAWMFFDAHDYYARKMASQYAPEDGVHLSDAKQAELAKAIGARLFPVVCRLARTRKAVRHQR